MLPKPSLPHSGLPNFAEPTRLPRMPIIKISLPKTLKQFVDQQATTAGYDTSNEYVRELIRRDQKRAQLRQLLVTGAQSKPTGFADEKYFAGLRANIKTHQNKAR